MMCSVSRGGLARHQIPRPQAHLRDIATAEGCPPEYSERDARALEHRDHPRHLQPRFSEAGRERGDGGRTRLAHVKALHRKSLPIHASPKEREHRSFLQRSLQSACELVAQRECATSIILYGVPISNIKWQVIERCATDRYHGFA